MAIEAARAFEETYQVRSTPINLDQATLYMLTAMKAAASAEKFRHDGKSDLAAAQIAEVSSNLLPEVQTRALGVLAYTVSTSRPLTERQAVMADAFINNDSNPFLQRFAETNQMLFDLSGDDLTFLNDYLLTSTPEEAQQQRVREHNRLTNKFYDLQTGETWDQTDEEAWIETQRQVDRLQKYFDLREFQRKTQDLDGYLDLIRTVVRDTSAGGLELLEKGPDGKERVKEDGMEAYGNAVEVNRELLDTIMAGKVEEWIA